MNALLLLFHLLLSAVAASSFRPGSICDDVDPHDFLRPSGKTSNMALSSKHVRVVLLEWAPFAMHDANMPSSVGWSGVDVELLQIIAGRLNFTYDIVPLVRTANETWTDTLFRHLLEGDLVCAYWMNTRQRRSRAYMLNGHIDSSIVLAGIPPKIVKPTFRQKLFTFMHPFASSAWLSIMVLCLVSGLGYYLIEGLGQGDLYCIGSFYESLNVLVFGRKPKPKDLLAQVHEPLWGFVALVLIAAYTANLATFMTMRSTPYQRIKSIGDIVTVRAPVCMYEAEPLQAHIFNQYPGITKWSMRASYLEAGEAMMAEQGCAAMVLPRVEAQALETKDQMCGMQYVGQPLIPNEAGWVTTAASACVGLAIETELQDLYVSGVVNELVTRFQPNAKCIYALHSEEHGGGDAAVPLEFEDIAGVFILYLTGLAMLVIYKIIANHCVKNSRWYKRTEASTSRYARRVSGICGRGCLGNPEARQEVTLDALMEELQKMRAEVRDQQTQREAA
mmetsp:Transcript_72427/g.155068  ORF Transcript_72427/g.155068 Transcript_72427/m.155068 type:complete len:504 (+) Transcript_72427:69-1580(+)